MDCHEIYTCIHVPFRMNYNHFGDPMTLPLAQGHNVNLSNNLIYDKIIAKRMHAASAPLCVLLI